MKFDPDPVVDPALSIEHDADRDQWVLYVSDEHVRRGIVLTEGMVNLLAARVAEQKDDGMDKEWGVLMPNGGIEAVPSEAFARRFARNDPARTAAVRSVTPWEPLEP